jgi:4-hydroxy-tetrahydrodipicolinate synthase
LKRVAEERHGYPMGTVRPPLVPVSSSFDVVSASALALSGPES